jgi:hypothetical protein
MEDTSGKELKRAIAEDRQLQYLTAQKVNIYSLATPTIILQEGKEETVWFTEQNDPSIKKINEMIDFRIYQLTEHYSKL